MYNSSAYGRPPMGAPQGGVQYPGMQQQSAPPTYANPYGGGSQGLNAASFRGAPTAPQVSAAPQPSAVAPQSQFARSLAPQPQPLAPAPVQMAGPSARERQLDEKVRQLEQVVAEKDLEIRDLSAKLATALAAVPAPKSGARGAPGRGSGSGFRKAQDATPVVKYKAIDQDDPVDIRLEEFYNTTDSAIQFKRINKGFYRFGDSIVELDIMNHKLMAKTEDGWNRGKFGPVEKFLMYYENIERERIGLVG